MQEHCGLRLFFQKCLQYSILLMQWSVVLRLICFFLLDKGVRMTLFRIDWPKDLFSLLFETDLYYLFGFYRVNARAGAGYTRAFFNLFQ